ncbi:MAG: HspR [Thermomicrobiales bacterium]|jgi:MerR family transcriptional regulator/heat shock protein HspR|nr:HspR [Thermomicrobiales bacterium]
MSDPGCEPVFIISVAARLLEMHPQTLRKYEREGLVAPSRTSGKFRLYSDEDLERLRQVKYLVGERGLNLAGVQVALEATEQIRSLQARLAESGAASTTPDVERLASDLNAVLRLLGAGKPQRRR